MVIIKLCYSSQTPMPEEILKKIDQKFLNKHSSNFNSNKENSETDKPFKKQKNNYHIKPIEEKNVEENKEKELKKHEKFLEFDELLSSLIKHKEGLLHAKLINNIYLKSFDFGEIKLKVLEENSDDLIKKINEFLLDKTGFKWKITEVDTDIGTTYNEIKNANIEREKEIFSSVPVFKEVKDYFPDAEIKNINKL